MRISVPEPGGAVASARIDLRHALLATQFIQEMFS
jgi:hypothetical protein